MRPRVRATRRPLPPAAVGLVLALGLLAPGTALAGPSPSWLPAADAADAAIPAALARTDRVLVRWTTNRSAAGSATAGRLRALSLAAGSSVRFVRITASGSAVYALDQQLGEQANAILAALGRVAGVAHVEADLWMTADVLPNDTYAASMWGLLGSSLSSARNFGIDATGAWATTTGSGVVVAVIDTGILFNHPDLVGQTVSGYDLIGDILTANDGDGRDSNAADPGDWVQPSDGLGPGCPFSASSWHGSHVAGTIAAKANNAIGVFGGAPGVKIQPVRVLGKCGGFLSDVADGIAWASGGSVPGVPANGTPADILNLSLGGGSPTCPSEYSSAIAGARSRGSVVVVAAGNADANASGFTPANCSAAVTVAATMQNGRRAADFSNFGSSVDIAAPGVGIKSTLNSGQTTPNSAGYIYGDYNGTSMATPHVALTAALLKAAAPSLTAEDIEDLIRLTATNFAPDSSSDGCPALGCGAGIVNAARAIHALTPSGPSCPRTGCP
ncbi:MAG TPA: S8 family peptidase [Candidatus Limnocylindrales bacterium]|jgi:serine protease|nr:S8 family peptidase [Candidatus Limnocylindrales bacterium]